MEAKPIQHKLHRTPMLGSDYYHEIVMTEIERAILIGLQQFGRTKTFKEILELADLHPDDATRLEVAYALEAQGLIQSVSYQLPLSLRAELTAQGKEVVRTLREGASGVMNSLLKFLQFNPLFL